MSCLWQLLCVWQFMVPCSCLAPIMARCIPLFSIWNFFRTLYEIRGTEDVASIWHMLLSTPSWLTLLFFLQEQCDRLIFRVNRRLTYYHELYIWDEILNESQSFTMYQFILRDVCNQESNNPLENSELPPVIRNLSRHCIPFLF